MGKKFFFFRMVFGAQSRTADEYRCNHRLSSNSLWVPVSSSTCILWLAGQYEASFSEGCHWRAGGERIDDLGENLFLREENKRINHAIRTATCGQNAQKRKSVLVANLSVT